MKRRVSAAAAGVCLILLQAACGGGGAGPTAPSASPSPRPSPSPAVLGPVDAALVGTWNGTVCCTFGRADMTMNLDADGTAWFEGTGRYCRAIGRWGRSGTEFTAMGGDCDGTNITLVAPVSSTTLAGRYTTSRGGSGSFSVTKQ